MATKRSKNKVSIRKSIKRLKSRKSRLKSRKSRLKSRKSRLKSRKRLKSKKSNKDGMMSEGDCEQCNKELITYNNIKKFATFKKNV
jgi:hypothetical protein